MSGNTEKNIYIHIIDNYYKPIKGAKVILLAMGNKSGQKIKLKDPTNDEGEVTFDAAPHLKDISRFEITIEHKDYYAYPINRVRKLIRSYESSKVSGVLCIAQFEKIPIFHFNGKMLKIWYLIYGANVTRRYPVNVQLGEDTQEFYIKLKDQKSLEFYTDEGCRQKSGYTLCLDTEQGQHTKSNDKNLCLESQEDHKRLKQDVQAIIAKDNEKGNTNCVHRVVIGWEKITLEMLKAVFEYTKASNTTKGRMDRMLPQMVDELNRIQDDKPMYIHYNLDTRARLEHFFAQCYVEVAGHTFQLSENMNYTNAGQLRKTFKNQFESNEGQVAMLVKIAPQEDREKAIANYVYANRNGNKGGDDGWNFRGRGLLHLTWRDNYRSCTKYLHNKGWLDNDIDFESQPQLVTDSGVHALLSAVYFWNDRKCYPNAKKYPELSIFRGRHLYEIADDKINGNVAITKEKINTIQSVLAISLTINGGTNGLSERTTQHARIKNANIFKDF